LQTYEVLFIKANVLDSKFSLTYISAHLSTYITSDFIKTLLSPQAECSKTDVLQLRIFWPKFGAFLIHKYTYLF